MTQPAAWREIARPDVLRALDAIGERRCEGQQTLDGMPEPPDPNPQPEPLTLF